MTEQQAQELLRTRTVICDFQFFKSNFFADMDPNSEYRTRWLWHDQSGDIWFDLDDVYEFERFMNVSPNRITDTLYIRKWLRMFLKKRPSFDFNNLKDELYEEIERIITLMFTEWFRFNKNGMRWNVCDPILHQPKKKNYTDFSELIDNYDKLLVYFNLDVWKQVIEEYQVPQITIEQVNAYKRQVAEQNERILALESELKALKEIHKIENHITQLNMGNGTQSSEHHKIEQK